MAKTAFFTRIISSHLDGPTNTLSNTGNENNDSTEK